MTSISVTLPIRTVSEANNREHWRVKHARSKQQMFAVAMMLLKFSRSLQAHKGSFHVELTRIGVRKLDGDNLQRSFKAIRDQVAKVIGIDDGSDRIEWRYAQERGKPKEYAIRIEIEAKEAVHA